MYQQNQGLHRRIADLDTRENKLREGVRRTSEKLRLKYGQKLNSRRSRGEGLCATTVSEFSKRAPQDTPMAEANHRTKRQSEGGDTASRAPHDVVPTQTVEVVICVLNFKQGWLFWAVGANRYCKPGVINSLGAGIIVPFQ